MSYVECSSGHDAIVNQFIIDEMHLTDISDVRFDRRTLFIVRCLLFFFRNGFMDRRSQRKGRQWTATWYLIPQIFLFAVQIGINLDAPAAILNFQIINCERLKLAFSHCIQFTRYCSAFFLNSTTSRYQWIEWPPPFITVLLSLLLKPSSAKPKFSLSVCAFLCLISLAYCENGRTDFRANVSSRLQEKIQIKSVSDLLINLFNAHFSGAFSSLNSGSNSCRDADFDQNWKENWEMM